VAKSTRLSTLAVMATLVLAFTACSGGTSTATKATASSTSSSSSGDASQSSASSQPPGSSQPSGSSESSGSSQSSASSDGGADPACALVTNDQVSAAAGFKIVKSEGVASALTGTDICTFFGAQEGAIFDVTILSTPDSQRLYAQIEPGSDKVANLGDSAFFAPTLGLFVHKGGLLLGLQIPGGTNDRAAFEKLAAQALPNL
jgi:hypothetical protein